MRPMNSIELRRRAADETKHLRAEIDRLLAELEAAKAPREPCWYEAEIERLKEMMDDWRARAEQAEDELDEAKAGLGPCPTCYDTADLEAERDAALAKVKRLLNTLGAILREVLPYIGRQHNTDAMDKLRARVLAEIEASEGSGS